MRLACLRNTWMKPTIDIVSHRSLRRRTVTLDHRHDMTPTSQKQRSSQSRKPTPSNHHPSHITPPWHTVIPTHTHPPTQSTPTKPSHADAPFGATRRSDGVRRSDRVFCSRWIDSATISGFGRRWHCEQRSARRRPPDQGRRRHRSPSRQREIRRQRRHSDSRMRSGYRRCRLRCGCT